MTTPEADEPGQTAPIELPGQQTPPSPPVPSPSPEQPPAEPKAPQPESPVAEPEENTHLQPPPEFELDRPVEQPRPPTDAEPLAAAQREVVYVPLAVNIGDGFKFGCGFFLASVVAGLVGFVLLAALFLLMGVLGLNLPLGR